MTLFFIVFFFYVFLFLRLNLNICLLHKYLQWENVWSMFTLHVFLETLIIVYSKCWIYMVPTIEPLYTPLYQPYQLPSILSTRGQRTFFWIISYVKYDKWREIVGQWVFLWGYHTRHGRQGPLENILKKPRFKKNL